MADILDELLSDEKDEKRFLIFRKVFPVIIVFTFIIALVIAFYSWYSKTKISHNQEIGDVFVKLILANEKDQKLDNKLQELILSNDTGVSELADIKLATSQIENDTSSAAFKSLEMIIENTKYSDITKSYARILYIIAVLDLGKLSSDEENKVNEYMNYFNKDSQIFYATATLLKSLYYLKNSTFDLANKYALEVLNLPRASGVLKEQANAVLLGIDYNKNT